MRFPVSATGRHLGLRQGMHKSQMVKVFMGKMKLEEVLGNGELTEKKMMGVDGHWCLPDHEGQEKMKEMELVSFGQGLGNDFSIANETQQVIPFDFSSLL